MRGDLILGVETSCDDTSVALVARDGTVAACETVSQFEIHAGYGGVFPELASRAHLQAILPTLRRVLDAIDGDLGRIAAIGATRGPGLIGSLLVGLNAAQGLGAGWGKPVYGVNHLRGHLRSPELEGGRIAYPALVLLVSGGHTALARMAGPGEVAPLGTTRDDSVGETFDKVARMLGLGMPGGPAVDRLAQAGRPVFDLPRPMLREGFAFSFSGLKSAVARLLETTPEADPADVAASFVAACADVLEAKLRRGLRAAETASVVIVGGVAANSQLRARAAALCAEEGTALTLPSLRWATDNAAMIALAAWDHLEAGRSPVTRPTPSLSLADW